MIKILNKHSMFPRRSTKKTNKGSNKFATKSQTRIRFTSSGVFSVLPGKSYQWWTKVNGGWSKVGALRLDPQPTTTKSPTFWSSESKSARCTHVHSSSIPAKWITTIWPCLSSAMFGHIQPVLRVKSGSDLITNRYEYSSIFHIFPKSFGQKCKKKCERVGTTCCQLSQKKSWAVGSTYSTATRPREKMFSEKLLFFFSGFNLRKCGKNLLNLLDLWRWRCFLNSPSNGWWENMLFEHGEYPIYCGRMLKMNTEDSEQRSNESSFEQLLKNCFEVERL